MSSKSVLNQSHDCADCGSTVLMRDMVAVLCNGHGRLVCALCAPSYGPMPVETIETLTRKASVLATVRNEGTVVPETRTVDHKALLACTHE